MFSVVPKSIWNKLNPADENNMCSWAMRCLLIEDGDKLILIDNGIGNKQDDKFMGFYLHGDATLMVHSSNWVSHVTTLPMLCLVIFNSTIVEAACNGKVIEADLS